MSLSCTQGGQAHHNMAQRLWQGIKDSTKEWTIVTEQTVAGLQGLPQPEEQIDAWQRAWNEVDNLHLELEGEEVQADADMAAQRKRPGAWAISCKKRRLLILEFTRPNDRSELSLHETDLYKTARYKSLRDLLARLLPGPGWEVEVQTYTVSI